MVPSTAPIRTSIVLSLQAPEGDLPLDADLSYDPADPFAIRLDIAADAEQPITWFFSRDLVLEGTTARSGLGDVQVEPVGGRRGREISLTLTTPDGHASFRTSLPTVVEFLTAVYTAVPTGAESDQVDLDAVLAQLLG